MPPTHSGRHNGFRHPSRRHRFDDFGGAQGKREPGARKSDRTGPGHSGRRFVIVAGLVVLLTWGGLYLAFQRWRAGYRQRVAYGISHVVAAVDPLKEIVPPDVDAGAWRDAVEQTHAMLTTLVSSNLLDLSEMDKLRGELDGFVTRIQARPESAKNELAAIWNEMADRAEFLFQDSRAPARDRHIRPKILPPRPAKAESMGKRKNASAAH